VAPPDRFRRAAPWFLIIFGASGIFALFPRFHLTLEWVGDVEESINDAGRVVREFNTIISPGFRAAVLHEEKLQVVVGAAAPIGLNRKADNTARSCIFLLSTASMINERQPRSGPACRD
jgi:hypothetical protein